MCLWTELGRGRSGSHGKGMLFVMCITPAAPATTKAEIVTAAATRAMKHNIMSYTIIAKSNEIVTRIWELEKEGAEREGAWCVRDVAQGRRWMRAFRSGRKGNAYRVFAECRQKQQQQLQ